VLTVRWAIHKIDYATEEADKATELAFKLSEARARELTAQRLKQVQDVSARRDELYDERLNAAKSLAAAGRHEEAAEAFAAIVAREGRSATGAAAQRLRAESLLAAGKSAAAAAELEDFVRNNPDHPEAPEARVLLAEANYASKSFSSAVEAATRAVAARPDGPLAVRARVVRARARLELAERNDALQDAMWVKDHAASTDPAYIAAVEVITAVTGEALPEPPTDEAVLPR
jgi:TolA-binding protein